MDGPPPRQQRPAHVMHQDQHGPTMALPTKGASLCPEGPCISRPRSAARCSDLRYEANTHSNTHSHIKPSSTPTAREAESWLHESGHCRTRYQGTRHRTPTTCRQPPRQGTNRRQPPDGCRATHTQQAKPASAPSTSLIPPTLSSRLLPNKPVQPARPDSTARSDGRKRPSTNDP